jgi:hypothetical protein
MVAFCAGQAGRMNMPRIHPLEYEIQSRDISYQALADEIFDLTKHRRNQDCWRKIARGQTRKPHSRTEYALKQYLAYRKKARLAARRNGVRR